MKMGLLALISTAAAVPHYGAHSKFHSAKPSATGGYGQGVYPTAGSPYPTGGQYNSTVVPYPTGSYDDYEEGTKTIDVTKTSTSTIYSTITVKRPTGEPTGVAAENEPEGQCGGTVTVTASEKVTITVTGDYNEATPTPEAHESKPVEDGYSAAPAPTPEAEKPTEYPAEPAPSATSSKAEYATPSVVEKPVQSSSAPSSGNGYSGGKRGLAYNDASLCKNLGGNFGFGYNWGQVESNDIGTGFIPMMHGPSKSTAEEWLANVEKAVQKGSTAVMGFNECDHAEQCNLSPEAACSAWKTYMNPVKSAHKDVTIIGPSVTNGGAPMGLDWLSRFHDCCPDATIDATNIHFYDIYEEATIDRFKAQIEKAAQLYGKPVWVTEFGLNPGSASEEQAASFLKECMEYLDSSDKVQGYSWFMVGEGQYQLNSGNGPSAVGKVYAGAA